jgi:hypothetical protein
MVFALMAGFVVVITMSAIRSPVNPLIGAGETVAGAQTVPAGTGGAKPQASQPADGHPAIWPASPRLDALLAAAMGSVLRSHPGRLAVGVVDETAGRQAMYAADRRFTAGPVIAADILAALLVRQEHAGTQLTTKQAALATAMMADRSGAATTSLWRAVGGGNGLVAANRLLGLRQTIPGPGDRWDQTMTTVADQLQLLIDLTSGRSRLTAAGRDYMQRLMASHGTQLRWGVSAAGTGNAAQGGSQLDARLWAASSIGIVQRGSHMLLVVVLSSGSSSQPAGVSLASAAAVAAANVITQAASA